MFEFFGMSALLLLDEGNCDEHRRLLRCSTDTHVDKFVILLDLSVKDEGRMPHRLLRLATQA
jgi:hypothetical protein